MEIFLIISSIIFRGMSTYCFLFQRTTRKIRMYANDNSFPLQEVRLFPDWYSWLLILSNLGYLTLFILLFFDWKISISIYVIFTIINMYWPTDDYGNIQKIKKHFEKKYKKGMFEHEDQEYYDWVLKAEEKSL